MKKAKCKVLKTYRPKYRLLTYIRTDWIMGRAALLRDGYIFSNILEWTWEMPEYREELIQEKRLEEVLYP